MEIKQQVTKYCRIDEKLLQNSLFHNFFLIYIQFQESNYIFICEMRLFDLVFPQICKSDMSRYGYLEVFMSPLDFEITRDGMSLILN